MSANGVYAGLLAQIPASILGDEYDNLAAVFTAIQAIADAAESNTEAVFISMMSASMVAAVDIPAESFVAVNTEGKLILASQQSLLGYITEEVKQGGSAIVQMEGRITNAEWALSAGVTYYLHPNGSLTTTWQLTEQYPLSLVNTVYSLHIRAGVALTETSLYLCPAILGIVLAFSV